MGFFRVLNFGCRTNQADGAALQRQMLEEGWQEASELEACDVALLNTCTVTATADAELRKIVRRIHRQSPGCKILVTGCYAQR
ncbi:MAG: tRNA (N(6)-L-threonylcarbamoyladenosine(37)-C(2))-methylthiotransferase MtaB, partial [Acidobacteria bacterium]|nr:tRNA (N(6)-L-threonylcarbamoyladenosine(37)-C(2))-methylthiotransferase MtaB [Acidobacteriota bacterium]